MAERADDPRRALPDSHCQRSASAGRAHRGDGEHRLTSFADQLRARIAAEGGIGVDDYMVACNAHYYATRDPLGSAGDFITAPEVSQMFGELIGAALADCWLRAGAPADAVYAEVGPGRGTLAVDALRVMRGGGFAGEVHFVETSPVLRAAQAKAVPDAIFHNCLAGLPPRPLLLVANEYLDALPVQQWVGNQPRKIVIENGGLRFAPEGEISEASPARDAEIVTLTTHLAAHGGAALIIDYGYRHAAPGDSLQAVRSHAFADPLANPGEQDLTAHVDFGAVAKVSMAKGASVTPLISQATFLERLGIAARAMSLASKNPPQGDAVVAARRRLCDASEMGELFKVIAIYSPGWPEPAGFRA